jgi:hypothetical protein
MARVEAWVEPGNETSQRLLSCAGFTREGVLRSFLGFGAARADVVVFARIAEDPSAPTRCPPAKNGFQNDRHARTAPGWRRWIDTRHLAGTAGTCLRTARRPTWPRTAPVAPSFWKTF